MGVSAFLSPRDTVTGIRAADTTRVLQEVSHRAAARLELPPGRIAAEILKREEWASTGPGGGVAIPHARIQGLTKWFGILARLTRAIDFAAIDSRPVDLVFLLLLPANPVGEQLGALASIARKFRDPAFCATCAPPAP